MEKFQFEHIDILWFLIIIPIMLIIYLIQRSRADKKLSQLGDSTLLKALAPDKSERKSGIRLSLYMFVFALLILGLAKPQLGSKLETVERKGIDLVIAIDVSKSMLAEDVGSNRLEKAKLFVSKLIDNLSGDRLGLIVYAGEH